MDRIDYDQNIQCSNHIVRNNRLPPLEMNSYGHPIDRLHPVGHKHKESHTHNQTDHGNSSSDNNEMNDVRDYSEGHIYGQTNINPPSDENQTARNILNDRSFLRGDDGDGDGNNDRRKRDDDEINRNILSKHKIKSTAKSSHSNKSVAYKIPMSRYSIIPPTIYSSISSYSTNQRRVRTSATNDSNPNSNIDSNPQYDHSSHRNNINNKSNSDNNSNINNNSSNSNPSKSQHSSYYRRNIIRNLYTEENLGENFDETPWLPPSIIKAIENKETCVYRGGYTSLNEIHVVDAPDLSIGVQMYFQFVKSISICMFVITILSIPCLLFIYPGQKIAEQDRDVIGFYRFTVGNIGYDSTSSTYTLDSACKTASLASYNGTCIHFDGQELTLDSASYIITAMECAQIVVFLLTYLYLKHRLHKLRNDEVQECSMCDYSVAVTSLPPNTTVSELVEHFSNLYPLDRADWKGRPGVLGCHPVEDVFNSGNPVYLGTWISECILHKKIGGFLSAFKNREGLTDQLYHYRAQMKMYSENTPHAHGPNINLYEKAEKNMITTAIRVENVAKKELKANKIKIKPMNNITNDRNCKIEDPQAIIDADVVAAFICFEYTESMARCVEDYTFYSSFPWSLIYPRTLKFHGRKIKVRKAPDPEEIAWENLEIKSSTKFLYRARNIILALLLSVAAFVMILESTIYRNAFSSNIPSNTICSTTIPSLYQNITTETGISSVSLVRPSSSYDQNILDNQCKSIIPNSFYAVYGIDGNFNQPVVSYTLDACYDSSTNLCPKYGQSSPYCPCITTTSSQLCYSKECQYNDKSSSLSSSSSCTDFKASFIGYCYCKQELVNILLSAKTNLFNQILEQESSRTCSSFFYNYSISIGLSYVSIVVTIIVNKMLLNILDLLTKSESYNSLGKYHGSLMMKTFLLMYVNLCILIILASGKSTNLPIIFKFLHIFDGIYTDFTPSWYGNIGTYFITSFILQSIFPLLSKSLEYYIINPLRRRLIYPKVMLLTSHSIVQQKELNKLEVGPVFDTTVSSASILSLLFFSMTFGSGLPIMMPIACVIFALYFRIDKVLLCRYNQRPPHVSEHAIHLAINTLPYAALVRLAIGCWMYSNSSVFPQTSSSSFSSSGSVSTYKLFLTSLQTSWQSSIPSNHFLSRRLCRQNVFPLFVFFLIIIAIGIGSYLWNNFKLVWIKDLFDYYCCRKNIIKLKNNRLEDMIHPFSIHKKQNKLRSETAPFSKEFYKFLKNRNEIPNSCYQIFTDSDVIELSEDDIDNGWMLIEKDGYVMKVLPRISDNSIVHHQPMHSIVSGAKQISASEAYGTEYGDRNENGNEHGHGYKYTYEFIADHGCNSYSLHRIPAYKNAITALTENTLSILDDEESDKSKDDKSDDYHHNQIKSLDIISMKGQWKNRPNGSNILNEKNNSYRASGNSILHRIMNKPNSPTNWNKDVNDEVAKLKESLKPSSISQPITTTSAVGNKIVPTLEEIPNLVNSFV